MAISGCRTSAENVDLSPPVQNNVSPADNSRTTTTVSFHDITRMKPCPGLSPNQLSLGIAYGTETAFIREEDTTSFMRCPVFVLLTTLNGAAGDQLSKRCSVQDGGQIGNLCEGVWLQ
ncbi:uncharacterized protein TNCV_4187271 [Trichonephila clavipes]|nr:uncharacterized protein TNCV_4187271 [Trichonephila clavipes]